MIDLTPLFSAVYKPVIKLVIKRKGIIKPILRSSKLSGQLVSTYSCIFVFRAVFQIAKTDKTTPFKNLESRVSGTF